ncbi:hypothetical protein [Dactylosporangium sp. NPDC050588]|uniref:hypothetical protein n=1 Tax=Dactylosporangium sp. NPDC050588 TaxID=3157211 RepID=UPI0033DB4962
MIPGEKDWTVPVVRQFADAGLDVVDRWSALAGTASWTEHDTSEEALVLRRSAELRAARDDEAIGDADLLLLTQWLVHAPSRSTVVAMFSAERGLRNLDRLQVEDGAVTYGDLHLGPAVDIAVDLAGVLASGVAGNVAHDLLKRAVASYRGRRSAPGRPDATADAPLARADALAAALGAVTDAWPEHAPHVDRFAVRQEQRTATGVWRFVLVRSRDIFTVYVPPGEPSFDRIEVRRQAG